VESYKYRLWGQVLLCDLDLGLPEAQSAHAGSTSVRIQFVSQVRLRELTRTESLHCTNEDGSIWLTISRSSPGYILDFPGLCSFDIEPEDPCILYAPEPGAASSTIVHLILDHALPRLISLLKGYFVLHASAWVVGERAILALGQSGAGKSTMASWFGAQGYPILTDDCLVLRQDSPKSQWMALPSYPSVRLWPDSIDAVGIDDSALREFAHYSGKRRTAERQD